MRPYCLGLGFAIGLGHEKRIVLQTFTDEQLVENLNIDEK